MAVPPDDSTRKPSPPSLPPTGEGVVIDIGTGDGLFAYHCARENPNKFVIGIDASRRPLEKISEKIHRKREKGGAPNALFLQAPVEDLPSELDGVADEVHVHFPWGSLLHAVATGDPAVLLSLRRLCAPEALLEIVMGLDPDRDRSEIDRLGLPELTVSHIDTVLTPRFAAAGLEVLERGSLAPAEWGTLRTSWAKRLRGGGGRSVTYLIARAGGSPTKERSTAEP